MKIEPAIVLLKKWAHYLNLFFYGIVFISRQNGSQIDADSGFNVKFLSENLSLVRNLTVQYGFELVHILMYQYHNIHNIILIQCQVFCLP